MIPGGLVDTYGLRVCPDRCTGRCRRARVRIVSGETHVIASPDCVLMQGPPPVPGFLSLAHHTDEQLADMVDNHAQADRRLSGAASEELRRRREHDGRQGRRAP